MVNAATLAAARFWRQRHEELTKAKATEMEQRAALCRTMNLQLGVNRVPMDDNSGDVVITCSNNYTLDGGISAALYQIETGDPVNGPEIVEKLVTWKPTLSVSAYKELAPEHKALVDKFLTIKGATPAIKFEAKKEKK